MDNKFELIEDIQSAKGSKTEFDIAPQDESSNLQDDWRPRHYNASEHPLKLMV